MVFDTADENHRSAGSFFVNPIIDNDQADKVAARAADPLQLGEAMPRYATEDGRAKVPAAWLIERAGMAKGFGQGKVGAFDEAYPGGGESRRRECGRHRRLCGAGAAPGVRALRREVASRAKVVGV